LFGARRILLLLSPKPTEARREVAPRRTNALIGMVPRVSFFGHMGEGSKGRRNSSFSETSICAGAKRAQVTCTQFEKYMQKKSDHEKAVKE
jgi:hypothetical protein